MDTRNKHLPLVSFVVTYRNEEISLLRKCLDSIASLSLSKEEREIIVVDDGADISPVNELDDYADELIYVRQPNRGLGMARNMGISIATGIFLQFVNSDDYLLAKAYEKCLDIVRFKDPDIVMFNFSHNESKAKDIDAFNPQPITGAEYMRNNSLRGKACAYVFKRDILHNLRFPNDIVNEDEEFTPQLVLRSERLYNLDIPAYFHRGQGGVPKHKEDKRQSLKRLDDTLTVIRRLNRRADTLPYEERQAMNRKVAQLTMDYLSDIIVSTRSRHFLNERLEELESEGLFPLPDKSYTKKYILFSRMMKTSTGRGILLLTLPMFSKRTNNY